MIEKAIIQHHIRKAEGDFSTFMSKRSNAKNVVRVLRYAAKKANDDQQKLVQAVRK